jgi:hypothetical protein
MRRRELRRRPGGQFLFWSGLNDPLLTRPIEATARVATERLPASSRIGAGSGSGRVGSSHSDSGGKCRRQQHGGEHHHHFGCAVVVVVGASSSAPLRKIPRSTAHSSLNRRPPFLFPQPSSADRRIDPLLEPAGPRIPLATLGGHFARQQSIDATTFGPAGRNNVGNREIIPGSAGTRPTLLYCVDGPGGRCAKSTTLLFSSHTCSKTFA